MLKEKVRLHGFVSGLCIAMLLVVAGGLMWLIPTNLSGIEIIEKIEIVESGGDYHWRGKIKNVTNKPIKIKNMTVGILQKGSTTNDLIEKYTYYFPETFTVLEPHESYELASQPYNSKYIIPEKIVSINILVENIDWLLFGGKPDYSMQIILMTSALILAGAFILGAFFNLNINIKLTKRNKRINAYMATLTGGEVFLEAIYREKGQMGKSVVKTVASATKAAVSAFIIGFGSFKTYSTGVKLELILTKDGFLRNNCGDNDLSVNTMPLISKELLCPVQIKQGKNYVLLKSNAGQKTVYLKFSLKNSEMTSLRLTELLTNTFITSSEKT